MNIQAMFRALSCTVVVTLISCGQAAVSPSRVESDQDRLEQVYAAADRLVVSMITDRALSPFRFVRLGEKHVAKCLWIYRLDLHALADQIDTPPREWVAAVTVWTGGNPLNACLQGSLRLYRREGERIRLVGTTDDTPIVKAARSRDGVPGCGDLGHSLSSAIDRITAVYRSSDADGWCVCASYGWASGCGASGGASVSWLVRGERFFPREAHYSVEPFVIRSQYCQHWGLDVKLRKRTWFAPDPAAVVIKGTECYDPWLEAADLLLAAAVGKMSAERALGMASRENMKELAGYRVWGYEEESPCRYGQGSEDNSRQILVHVARERTGMDPVVGWLTLLLGGTPQQPTLESLQFSPDDKQPDWESFK